MYVKQRHIAVYLFKCMLFLEYFNCFTLPSDSPFKWGSEAVISKPPDSIYKSHFRTQELLVYHCLDWLVCKVKWWKHSKCSVYLNWYWFFCGRFFRWLKCAGAPVHSGTLVASMLGDLVYKGHYLSDWVHKISTAVTSERSNHCFYIS